MNAIMHGLDIFVFYSLPITALSMVLMWVMLMVRPVWFYAKGETPSLSRLFTGCVGAVLIVFLLNAKADALIHAAARDEVLTALRGQVESIAVDGIQESRPEMLIDALRTVDQENEHYRYGSTYATKTRYHVVIITVQGWSH
jgi:hypothetical protein